MANEVKLNEMDSLSINNVIDILSASYIKLLLDNKKFESFPSVMLWGQPGVGKSQAIRQIANNIETICNKKVVITDVRLLLFNPIDLRGIPVANEERTLAIWLKPKIFQMDDSKDVVNILFLDEISAAPQSVQSAAYQITLDRTVGEHKLPDNCIVIAAGNRVSDKSVAYKMPKALANRLMHFEINSSFENWKKWALHNNIHPLVVGFLGFRPDLLNTFNSSNEQLSFATPRSWEMVSNILNNIDDDIEAVSPLITGLIGGGIAYELKAYNKMYCNLPRAEDIFNGKITAAPKSVSEIFAICSMMIRYIKNNNPDSNKLTNAFRFASKLPKDFSILFIEELLSISPEIKKKIMAIPEFARFLSNNASILNGQKYGLFKQN